MRWRNRFVAAALVCAGGYLLYTKGLSPKAKESVKDAARGVKASYDKIADVIEAIEGHVVDDPDTLPNVQATEQQWENLGY